MKTIIVLFKKKKNLSIKLEVLSLFFKFYNGLDHLHNQIDLLWRAIL